VADFHEGDTAHVSDGGWLYQHLDGKNVTVLEDTTDFLELLHSTRVDVKCHCCGDVMRIPVDLLD
jgi:hypothetical protein